MNAQQSWVDALWADLETHYRPSLTPDDDRTLRRLDADAVDGTLITADFERTKRRLMAGCRRSYAVDHATGRVDPACDCHRATRDGELFGDYALIIDACLGGDTDVKAAVLKADNDGRRGLASLKYHLRKCKAHIPQDMAMILRTCEADQEYHDDPARQAAVAKPDMRNIEERGGRYRVSVMADGKRHRSTFGTLEEARQFRDDLTSSNVDA